MTLTPTRKNPHPLQRVRFFRGWGTVFFGSRGLMTGLASVGGSAVSVIKESLRKRWGAYRYRKHRACLEASSSKRVKCPLACVSDTFLVGHVIKYCKLLQAVRKCRRLGCLPRPQARRRHHSPRIRVETRVVVVSRCQSVVAVASVLLVVPCRYCKRSWVAVDGRHSRCGRTQCRRLCCCSCCV